MSVLKSWISAMRLRTLPLAMASILLGILTAGSHYSADIPIALLCLLTAVLLQVLSNFANDYGDFMKGTDNDQRIGNTRALQSGHIKPNQMLVGILLMVLLALISGISLLYIATRGQLDTYFLAFLILGLTAIAAAIKYTVGKGAYGYSGLGDVFVFIFFGPVSVIGTFLLCTHFSFDWEADKWILLPAVGVGLLSTAVLNTNNIRDIENDKASGKFTIPVKIGLQKARVYQTVLIGFALLSFLAYMVFHQFHWVKLIQLIAWLLILRTLSAVIKTAPSAAYNLLLKRLSLSTLLLVMLMIIGEELSRIYQLMLAVQQGS